MFQVEEIVVARIPITPVQCEAFIVEVGTEGIICDLIWEGGTDVVFYIVEFALESKQSIRAVVREHEIAQETEGPMLH